MKNIKKYFYLLTVSAALASCGQTSQPNPEVFSQTPADAASAVNSTEAEQTMSSSTQLTAASTQLNTNDWPVYKEGSSGEDVRTIQRFLKMHLKSASTLAVDGHFGAATERKVKEFQALKGLGADGVVGPTTWSHLLIEVEKGDANLAVQAVNDYFNIGTTIHYTDVTEREVAEFQRAHVSAGLKVTGKVDRWTWKALIAGVPGNRVQLAKAILNNGNITLADTVSYPADASDAIEETAKGLKATTAVWNQPSQFTKVELHLPMLQFMQDLSKKYSFNVTSITGYPYHRKDSNHYKGRGFDIGTINGEKVTESNKALSMAVMRECIAAGANEVLGPSNDPGHKDHVHCGWSPK
ncbi:hypothetical protein GCM10017783_26090 [Deinococcus piscis]|uniref:Peptidoglycan binding-like domain-containing protein n=1 Tax=Deinococcus piscis TaxID=394230 RepID=A0ABQ3KCQ2_9DEIO|nr:peptidoglycan-binding protein [Deinococcus piscis]GHG13010.1 hypothetical protein GCM10017783_26090 [Deinococcus piscis]